MGPQGGHIADCCKPGKTGPEGEGFSELLRYTGAGYAGGLLTGFTLDSLGFQQSPFGQWLVRTLSGEGESIFEGISAFRRRLHRSAGSVAEAYGWGKMGGMVVPWLIDWVSRLMVIDVYGTEGFYIPYFYALGDQIGANIAGAVFLRWREGTWGKALAQYSRHPVMVTSLAIVLIVPIGLLLSRVVGFRPTTQVFTALETIAANLCWVPPLVGHLAERMGKD